MRILIISDAWFPQVNGVVRTLDKTRKELEGLGHEVVLITPDLFANLPCPTYPEIRLAFPPPGKIGRLIDAAQPCAIHIATEGPLGLFGRFYCQRRKVPFTTAYHTRFPEYIQERFRLPTALTYRYMRWFHSASAQIMVATDSLQKELEARGFRNIVRWSRGVDTALFRPQPKEFLSAARPIFLYVGRVAVEKNIEAFLKLDLPGTKMVVGDGPQMAELKKTYPEVQFMGHRSDTELAKFYAAADVFVFPSRTDTFGLVLLEALASGVPVAAYPVTGPLEVVNSSAVGILDEDLGKAAKAALSISPEACREHALNYSWRACAEQFARNLAPFA